MEELTVWLASLEMKTCKICSVL